MREWVRTDCWNVTSVATPGKRHGARDQPLRIATSLLEPAPSSELLTERAPETDRPDG